MSYVIRTVLSNPAHPEYGQVTVQFPIPNGDYDRIIRMLEALGIGDALDRDCRVDELDSYYSVLKRLEGQSANLDELDYLAKRLDGFCAGEAAQFQGMTEKLDILNMTDFINLTFCCQQATVITDFSDLEQIGKDHYMNLHGGCASTEELNNLDGEETALLLIDSGAGVITPYGVVYDNGMKLEQYYDRRHFPCYHYEPAPITAGIVACYAPKTEEPKDWIHLPASQCQIDRVLARAGIECAGDAVLCNFENMLPKGIEQAIFLEGECIEALNDMCEAIAQLDQADQQKLEAAVAMAAPSNSFQVVRLAESIDLFDFVPGVHTPEEYGRYMIRESGHFEYDDNLDGFYDYEGYAQQRMSQELGQFVEDGYISYHGFLSLDEVMAGSQVCDEGFQMGGMQ